jgi:hypothetical protein
MSVTNSVIMDIKLREGVGIKKYGQTLETFNGRSALRDLYEELLDASQYIKQKMMEEEKIYEHLNGIIAFMEKTKKAQETLEEQQYYSGVVNGIVLCINELKNLYK